jgi:hypothetical protein
MAYSNQVEKFDDLCDRLRVNFSKYSTFIDYFRNNWLNIKHLWVECFREKQMNLGERTNNRIESLNCHLKELGNYTDSLLECYHSLMTSFYYFEQQKSFKRHIEKLRVPLFKRSDISEVNRYEPLINESVTQSNADYIVKQMNMAFKDLNFSFEKLNDNTYSIECDAHRPTKTTLNSCECFRFVNKNLPCFHLFALRKFLEVELFEKSLIPAQFDKNIYFQSSSLASPIEKMQVKSPVKSYSHISTSKFSKARIETDRLANVMSKSGQRTFDSQLSLVKNLTEAFAEKKEVTIMTSDVYLSSESSKDTDVSVSSKSSSLPPIIRPGTQDTLSIRPQHRERFVGRPSTQTAIGKTRSRPKPSLRIRKDKNLIITPLGSTAIKKPKIEINICDEV